MSMEQASADSIEQSANYEGNNTLLLIERLRNPVIRNQILALHKKYLPHAYDPDAFIDQRLDIDGDIEKALTVTYLDADMSASGACSYGKVFVNPTKPVLGSAAMPNTKQLSIVEAHEVGHLIRRHHVYSIGLYTKHFAPGFDTSHVTISDEEYEKWTKDDHPKRDYESVHQTLVSYLFTGAEVVERMAQLKNYFGFNGDEHFTKRHLDYARKKYIKDTGYDNHMTQFFQAITPETEESFIDLMNTSGV